MEVLVHPVAEIIEVNEIFRFSLIPWDERIGEKPRYFLDFQGKPLLGQFTPEEAKEIASRATRVRSEHGMTLIADAVIREFNPPLPRQPRKRYSCVKR